MICLLRKCHFFHSHFPIRFHHRHIFASPPPETPICCQAQIFLTCDTIHKCVIFAFLSYDLSKDVCTQLSEWVGVKFRNHTEEDKGIQSGFAKWRSPETHSAVMLLLFVSTATFPSIMVTVNGSEVVFPVWVNLATSCLCVRKTLM